MEPFVHFLQKKASPPEEKGKSVGKCWKMLEFPCHIYYIFGYETTKVHGESVPRWPLSEVTKKYLKNYKHVAQHIQHSHTHMWHFIFTLVTLIFIFFFFFILRGVNNYQQLWGGYTYNEHNFYASMLDSRLCLCFF